MKRSLNTQSNESSKKQFLQSSLTSLGFTSSRNKESKVIHSFLFKEKQRPPHWEEIWNLICEMRASEIAPVDKTGKIHGPTEEEDPKKLISLLISAQTHDEDTASCMDQLRLFGLTVEKMLSTDENTISKLISKATYKENKARYIKEICKILKDKYDGDIPPTLEELDALPGVGPKIGILCMRYAWKRTVGIGVDVHVHRICNRLGWVKTKSPEQTEKELQDWLPFEYWSKMNKLFVGFGQTVCKSVPRCGICKVNHLCPSAFQTNKQ